MQRVFVMYNLKKGVSMDEYKKWSREVDQKVTPKQPGVKSFKVFEIKGAEKGASPYQIVEDIEVDSWDAWQKVVKNDAMKNVIAQWPGDGTTSVVIYGDQI
jgi:hypothetical protein